MGPFGLSLDQLECISLVGMYYVFPLSVCIVFNFFRYIYITYLPYRYIYTNINTNSYIFPFGVHCYVSLCDI